LQIHNSLRETGMISVSGGSTDHAFGLASLSEGEKYADIECICVKIPRVNANEKNSQKIRAAGSCRNVALLAIPLSHGRI
jgi:hypothetical protein